MSALVLSASPALAGGILGFRLVMPWFVPVGLFLGALGTQTALEQRHLAKGTHRSQGWWLILLIAWLPTICWALAQFVPQY